jgi:hypothetical protein
MKVFHDDETSTSSGTFFGIKLQKFPNNIKTETKNNKVTEEEPEVRFGCFFRIPDVPYEERMKNRDENIEKRNKFMQIWGKK